MFDGKYLEWNQKRIKVIIDFYGYKFMYYKKVLDLGCGQGDVSGALYRLGADILALDARQDHLQVAGKKFPGLKTIKADLDREWPFPPNRQFDVIIDLGLVCHLRDYEAHIKTICKAATNVILETAVCDSDDPYKCVMGSENKNIFDLSINGVSSRPTAAAIERVLTEAGMNFKRMDSPKLNSGSYVYDWQMQNTGDCSIFKRRMWFAVRKTSPIQFAPPPAPPPPMTPNNSAGLLQNSPTQFKHPLVTTSTAVKVPVEPPPQPAKASNFTPQVVYSSNYTIDNVRSNSKEFAIIDIDRYNPPMTFATSGIILPTTASSRMWFKKVAAFFPNVKLHRSAHTMQGFNKIDGDPNIVMCSIDNLQVCNRIWIEEWSNKNITDSGIEILKKCQAIMTPSLANAQQILTSLPDANVIRVPKVWPLIPVEVQKKDYYIYLEKDPEMSTSLYNAWNEAFGKMTIVGSCIKTPSFGTYFSEYENYESLLKLMVGCTAIIDLSDDTYYMSGILGLAKHMHVPIITNNFYQADENYLIPISQDKAVSVKPTSGDINQAINKFIGGSIRNNVFFDMNHNMQLDEAMKKMMGV